MGLAVVGILATSLVLVLLNRLVRSTEEVARLLRTERPSPVVVAGEEDASIGERPSSADASPDVVFRRPRAVVVELPDDSAVPEDAGAPDVMAPADAASEDSGPIEFDAGLQPEPEPVVEAPQRIPCGWRICPEGEVCCNWSCSTCAPPGQACSIFCGAPSLGISIPCGFNTCNVTEICCNRTCGICVPSGDTCSQEPCLDTIYDPFSAPCGLSTCNVGEFCCNPSCGICAKVGEKCSTAPCP